MLRSIEVPCETAPVTPVTDEALSAVETLFLVNPMLGDHEWDAVFRHLETGGTAIVLLSPEMTAHTESVGLLARLGLRMVYTRRVKRLNLCYSESFPISHKRSHGDYMLCHEPTRFITFRPTGIAGQRVPLVNMKSFFSRHCLVMQVNSGQGAIVFGNSMSLPEDRADIVTHLLKMAAQRKPVSQREPPQLRLTDLLRTMATLFEVYDEIPLDVVARELAESVPDLQLDRLSLLSAIEKSIRRGELTARLRGDTVVKAW
jgi:hypothetical protein